MSAGRLRIIVDSAAYENVATAKHPAMNTSLVVKSPDEHHHA